MKVYERYWETCDVLEHAGYTPAEAVALAEAAVFPVPLAADEVDLMEPCPDVSGSGGPGDVTVDGWYDSADYHKVCVA